MYNFKIKTFINEENLLKFVSDYDIFKYYIYFKKTLSKFLGLAIVIFSTILKVP